MEFKHINDCWNYLDQFKTKEALEEAFGEIPSKFGSFDITNAETYKEDGYFEICNSYWDKAVGDYDYDYHCVEAQDTEKVKKLRVAYWDDINSQEVFGKTYEAEWDSEAEKAFYNDPETLNARMVFEGEYPLLVTED